MAADDLPNILHRYARTRMLTYRNFQQITPTACYEGRLHPGGCIVSSCPGNVLVGDVLEIVEISRLLAQSAKFRVLFSEQGRRCIVFQYFSVRKNQYTVEINDGVQPVCPYVADQPGNSAIGMS